jgi:hypothetical protein
MKKLFTLLLILVMPLLVSCQITKQNPQELVIKKSSDFTVTGDGSAKNWDITDWIVIPARSGSELTWTTKVKVLYSGTGIYFLFDCQDKKLTAAMDADFLDLWKEDVVEVFLWTDESTPAYFEYEISPLNYELPILISNENGDLVRWMPFHYDADRKTSHATIIKGGEKKSNAVISGWTTEFFIPFKLLRPLNNIIPASGTKWRANMYRVDYDDNNRTSWAWQLTSKTFHDYEKFGTIIFE